MKQFEYTSDTLDYTRSDTYVNHLKNHWQTVDLGRFQLNYFIPITHTRI